MTDANEHTREALLNSALRVRDLQTAIRVAIAAIERKSFETARKELMQALEEVDVRERRRER